MPYASVVAASAPEYSQQLADLSVGAIQNLNGSFVGPSGTVPFPFAPSALPKSIMSAAWASLNASSSSECPPSGSLLAHERPGILQSRESLGPMNRLSHFQRHSEALSDECLGLLMHTDLQSIRPFISPFSHKESLTVSGNRSGAVLPCAALTNAYAIGQLAYFITTANLGINSEPPQYCAHKAAYKIEASGA